MANNLQVKAKNLVDVVSDSIIDLEGQGKIDLPPDYSAANALRGAYLALQETNNRKGQPVLEACTPYSITNALLEMIIKGLNPAKEQCYFVAYGDQLSLMESYFGMTLIARQAASVSDVYAEVVHQDDKFAYKIKDGLRVITKHEQTLKSKDSPIVGAYCVVTFTDGRPPRVDVMTMKQIETAWKQGSYNPENKKYKSAHEKFPEEMARKVIIRRTLKPYVNSAVDMIAEVIDETKKEINASEEFIEITADDFQEKTPLEPENEKEEIPVSNKPQTEDETDQAIDAELMEGMPDWAEAGV